MKRILRISLILTMLPMLLAGCSGVVLPGLTASGNNTVKIGYNYMTETAILASITHQMITHYTDLHVEEIGNLGSVIVQQQAMEDGEIDITPGRYTGTDLSGALGKDPVTDPEKALKINQREFQNRFDQTYFNPYGFDNNYALTIRKDLAEKKHITKVSDLKEYASELKFGVDNSWIHRKGDGYPGFVKTYGFKFDKIHPMEIGLVYDALKNKKMDVVLAYSTDGRLKAFDLKTLKDDQQFFPAYQGAAVARNDILRKHPKVKTIMKKLVGEINTEQMTEMNYEADVELKEPSTVAKEFLKKHNYFEDKKVSS